MGWAEVSVVSGPFSLTCRSSGEVVLQLPPGL